MVYIGFRACIHLFVWHREEGCQTANVQYIRLFALFEIVNEQPRNHCSGQYVKPNLPLIKLDALLLEPMSSSNTGIIDDNIQCDI